MPITKANGVELFYEASGPESGPPIVFSNSLGTTLAMWAAQAEALSGVFRCIRYDTRGHGRSPVVEAAFTIDDLADDLAGLMGALGIERAHIVGLSLGGMTGQALAARRPELVERLILVATSAYMPPMDLWRDRAAMVRERGMEAVAGSVIGRWFTPAEAESAGAARTRAELVGLDPRGYARCCEAIGAMDLRARIGAIAAPTLIIAGAQDPATPVEMSEEIRSLIPGAQLAIVPDAAHLIAVERPDVLTSHIRAFLEAGASSRPGAAPLVRREPTAPPADTAAFFEAGLANRRSVLGAEYVDRSLANAGAFAGPWQDFITRYAWAEIWGDATLPWKMRSVIVLATTVALGREEEFKLHVRAAMGNGVTPDELRAILKQCAVYAGVPAANSAVKWARDVLGDELA